MCETGVTLGERSVQAFHWKRLDDRQSLYRYEPYWQGGPADPAAMPVVFLQPLPPETGTPLAEMFRADGLVAIYAVSVTDIDARATQALDKAISYLLRTYHPQHDQVILVGCASGGTLGYRYVIHGGYRQAAYLFMIGSHPAQSQLAALPKDVFEQREAQPVDQQAAAPLPGHTVLVNLYGNRAGARFRPEQVFTAMPDAVNVELTLEEEALCRHQAVYGVIRQYLSSQIVLVSVGLQRLTMRGAAGANSHTGPFCFEVNGLRVPFDGVFRVAVESQHEFDPAQTLLGTLAFPYSKAGHAVNIGFRLKDLAPPTDQRRKLFTSLHTPLRHGLISEHALQDSFGSLVGIQVRCERPLPVLDTHDQ